MTDRRCVRGQDCAGADKIITTVCKAHCDCHTGAYTPCSVDGGCGSRHYTDIARIGAVTDRKAGVCSACERVIIGAIAELPRDYAALILAGRGEHAAGLGEVVAATRELPIPISLTYVTLAEQIAAEVTTVAEPVAEAAKVNWYQRSTPRRTAYGPPPRYRPAVLLDKAAALLALRVPVLLALPPVAYRLPSAHGWAVLEADGLTMALALLALHRSARTSLGLTRMATRMPVQCPECEAASLVRIAGADGVRCQLCPVVLTDADYYRHVTELVDAQRRAG